MKKKNIAHIGTCSAILALLFGVLLLVSIDLISGAMRRSKENN